MNDLSVVEKAPEWRRLKALVLDSVSSPITRRVYNMALDEFVTWFRQEPRPGFSKATVNTWRVSLEVRGLSSSSISVRMSAVRKLAAEAADNGLLAPELAAGIGEIRGFGHRERVVLNDKFEDIRREMILGDLHQRFRDVRQGPDGNIYALTDQEVGALLKIEPAQ